MAKAKSTKIKSVVQDGNLTAAEALAALSTAAQAATNALPEALLKCTTREEMQKVLEARDTCQLAYLRSLSSTLRHTGPIFEEMASDLEAAAKEVKRKAAELKDAQEAIALLGDVVRLSAALALAFA